MDHQKEFNDFYLTHWAILALSSEYTCIYPLLHFALLQDPLSTAVLPLALFH